MSFTEVMVVLFLISCSSIPEGEMVMNKKIQKDRKYYFDVKNFKSFNKKVSEYLTIYAHPQVVNENVLLKEGLFLAPVEQKAKKWTEILKGRKRQ